MSENDPLLDRRGRRRHAGQFQKGRCPNPYGRRGKPGPKPATGPEAPPPADGLTPRQRRVRIEGEIARLLLAWVLVPDEPWSPARQSYWDQPAHHLREELTKLLRQADGATRNRAMARLERLRGHLASLLDELRSGSLY